MARRWAPGHDGRAPVEADTGRYKRVIGDAPHSATEVAVAACALKRMLGIGRPRRIRVA